MSGLLVAWMPFGEVLACGDVDRDGDFDASDVQLYRSWLAELTPLSLDGLAQCTVVGPARPCDVLNSAVMARSLAARPPGIGNVCQDEDQDGLADAADTCPGSPAGAASLGAGCTAIDLVLRPEPVTDPAGEVLGEVISLLGNPGLATSPEVQSLVASAGAAQLGFENARELLRGGDPCAASAAWGSALSALEAEREALQGELTRVRLQIAGSQGASSTGHFTDGELAVTSLVAGLTELDQGIDAAVASGGLLGSACAAVTGPINVQGRVSRVDDATRVIQLEGGQVFGLVDAGSATGVGAGFSIGQDVVVSGTGFTGAAGGPGSGIAVSVTPVDVGSPSDADAGYLFLRVAPVQPFPPHNTSPITLHYPEAYQRPSGALALEFGSRLAVVGAVNTPMSPQWTRYSAQIWISAIGNQIFTIADDLETGKPPAKLPSVLWGGFVGTLHLKVRKQFCEPGSGLLTRKCFDFLDVRSESYPLQLYARGQQCDTVIPVATTDLEDNDFVGFRIAVVDDVLVNPQVVEGFSSFAFEGQSCIAVPGAENCNTGQIVTTAEGDAYRLYTHDFYPIHPAAGTVVDTWAARNKHGVSAPYGLRWPHVKGTRNGATFWYSCQGQRIVRDVVDYCPLNAEDSYYRYPLFPGGSGGGWLLGMGNADGPPPAHSGGQFYAFDIEAPLGHEIRAARGGRVVVAEEDETDTSLTTDGEIETELCFQRLANCFALASQGPCSSASDCTSGQTCSWGQCVFPFNESACYFQYPCNIGNYVWVRHQDETIGVYFHLRQNGATVAYNDLVRRSNKVGEVGDTGNSYGEHLHFEAHRLDLASSVRSRFQTAAFQTPNICWVPQNGDPLPSNNDPSAFF